MKIINRLRFNTLFTIVIAIMISLILFNILQLEKGAIQKNRNVNNIAGAVFELSILTNEYVLNQSDRTKRQWRIRYNSLSKLIENLELEIGMESLLLEEIWKNYTILGNIFFQLTTESKGIDNSEEAVSRMLELRNRLADTFITKSQVMVSVAQQLTTIIGNKVISVHESSFLAMFLIVAILLLIAAINSMLLGKSIIKPIVKLQEGSQIIGEGNFDFKFELPGRDEFGELSRSFDIMTERLKEITVSRDELENEITERKQAEEEREKLISNLRAASAKIKTLSGIIPICAWCKKIRNDDGFWKQVEEYIRDHTEAEFSHGLCPECAAKMEKEFNEGENSGARHNHKTYR